MASFPNRFPCAKPDWTQARRKSPILDSFALTSVVKLGAPHKRLAEGCSLIELFGVLKPWTSFRSRLPRPTRPSLPIQTWSWLRRTLAGIVGRAKQTKVRDLAARASWLEGKYALGLKRWHVQIPCYWNGVSRRNQILHRQFELTCGGPCGYLLSSLTATYIARV